MSRHFSPKRDAVSLRAFFRKLVSHSGRGFWDALSATSLAETCIPLWATIPGHSFPTVPFRKPHPVPSLQSRTRLPRKSIDYLPSSSSALLLHRAPACGGGIRVHGELGALRRRRSLGQLGRVDLVSIGLIGKQVRRVHDAGIDVAARRLGRKDARQSYRGVGETSNTRPWPCEVSSSCSRATSSLGRGERAGCRAHRMDARQPLPRRRPVRRRPRGRKSCASNGIKNHRDGAGGNHNRCDVLRQRTRVDGNARHGNDDRQRRGAIERHGDAPYRRDIARRRTNAHRDKNGHGTNNQQRHDKAREQARARRHRPSGRSLRPIR